MVHACFGDDVGALEAGCRDGVLADEFGKVHKTLREKVRRLRKREAPLPCTLAANAGQMAQTGIKALCLGEPGLPRFPPCCSLETPVGNGCAFPACLFGVRLRFAGFLFPVRRIYTDGTISLGES